MTTQRSHRSARGRLLGFALITMLVPTVTGCDSFFHLTDPDVIEAASLDPVADGTMFSRSAFQSLATSLGTYVTYTAWFTNEAWVGSHIIDVIEFGLRGVSVPGNIYLNPNVFVPMARAISQAEQVLEVLDGVSGQDVNLARAALTSGYGLVLEASAFCEGTMPGPGSTPGPLMTPAQLLEVAVARFDKAIAVGATASGSEATSIVTAARVGKGRALLQLGRRAEAAAAVSGVAAGFTFNAVYMDDISNRANLGNGVFSSSGGSGYTLVVPPHYRAMNDPRVPWADAGRSATDGVLRMYAQRKYTGWASPIRLASGLEARYIEVEAGQNPAAMLAFVNERRAAGGQAAVSTTNFTELMGHLMDQKSRDFWLEGHRMGDWRRNPTAVPNILQPGSTFYKTVAVPVSDQTCMPLPYDERRYNPNIGG